MSRVRRNKVITGPTGQISSTLKMILANVKMQVALVRFRQQVELLYWKDTLICEVVHTCDVDFADKSRKST